MITSSQPILNELELHNKYLGTPSAQSVLELLSCWDQLAVKEIIDKTQFSESQIHSTLQNLEKIGLVQKKTRGIYSLTDSKFSITLKDAYMIKLEQVIGKKIYYLSSNLDKLSEKEIFEIWNELIHKWEPIIDKYFAVKASQIAGHIVDKELEE